MNIIQSTPSGKSSRSILLVLLICSLAAIQCRKTIVTTSSSAKLTFSASRLFFDTVFTTIGSTVRIFVVHNNNNQAVNVSSINVAGVNPTFFKINVDGISGETFSNVQIPANDSIYVFATLTVDPGNPQNPALIQDSLVFVTNGNMQSVELQGYGWNAYFYVPNVFPVNGPAYYLVTPADTDWRNDKPHVVFGYLYIPPGLALNIHEGTGVYLHDSAVIYVDSAAALFVDGWPTEPVTFQQDRLEPDYNYLPGQWNEIFMYKPAESKVSWAVIQNGQSGFEIDTVFSGSPGPALSIDHTIIKSMSGYGIFAAGSVIKGDDDLIADCQYGCLSLYIGGNYTFNQCTFADYWGVYNGYSQRTTPLLYMNNYYEDIASQIIPRPLKAFFGNCIVYGEYGTVNEELSLDSLPTYAADSFHFYFENCIVKSQLLNSHYHYNTYINQDPVFNGVATDDYQVGSTSPALNSANPSIASQYTLTLDNITRPSSGATIGAYQQ